MAQTKITLKTIQNHKKSDPPLVCLTSYTAPMTKILDPHCDVLLVGDSLGMVVYGMENTVGVTLDMMINHGKAVANTAQHAFVIVDMPYGTYENDMNAALENSKRLFGETGGDALKLEVNKALAPTVELLVNNGIPVQAHIGLRPQSVIKEGGYKIKGKTNAEIADLIDDALALEKAGAFSILIEGTKEAASRAITTAISVPTVGIGASPACDGQILVVDDMLGMITDHTPKFVKKYAALADEISVSIEQYASDVRARKFPNEKYVY